MNNNKLAMLQIILQFYVNNMLFLLKVITLWKYTWKCIKTNVFSYKIFNKREISMSKWLF